MSWLEKIDKVVNKESQSGIAGKIYNVLMMVAIVASIIPLMFMEKHKWFSVIEYVTVIVFILDYLARWVTSEIRTGKGKLALLIYPFTPMAIIDLLSIIPAIHFIDNSFKLFRLTRLLRVVRVFKMFRYSSKIQILGRVLYNERHVLVSVLMLAVFYIFVTALIMFNIEPHTNPSTGNPTFHSFFDALYWASVTLTTVGYGDLCPVTELGRLVSIISSLFGVAIIALPSGVVTAGYMDELKRSREKKDNGKE